jgi:hypothetical protein
MRSSGTAGEGGGGGRIGSINGRRVGGADARIHVAPFNERNAVIVEILVSDMYQQWAPAPRGFWSLVLERGGDDDQRTPNVYVCM